MKPTCIILAGPTAVGKTAVAVALARMLDTSIISADSRQCFRELGIGVAKPSAEELDAVPHYFINSHSIHETVNAALFARYALEQLQAVFSRSPFAVVAGGTGLYIRALTEGMDPIPETDPLIRERITELYRCGGISWLRKALQLADPRFAASGEMQNPQRMMRALEVMQATGRSVLDWRSGRVAERDFRIIRIGLDLPREELYRRINERAGAMLAAGLEAEAEALRPFQALNALQTVGYREWWPYFEGEISREEVLRQISQHTRQYAKRQLTWFRKEAGIQWTAPEFEAVRKLLMPQLS